MSVSSGTEQRPLVIANPAARKGHTRREIGGIVQALRARIGPLDVAPTERAGHAIVLAAGAVADRRPLVISVGGDGLLNEVVNGLLTPLDEAGTGREPAELPVLAIVGAGTGGDFGRSLGIDPDREAYLAAVAGGRERQVDVGRARFRGRDGGTVERYFVNVLSAGIGGLVDRYAAAMPAAVPGRAAYGAAALAAVVVCRRRRILCRATLADGATLERLLDSHAVVIANGTTFGGGMRVAPAARVDDGVLDVVLLETPTKLTMLRHFASIYRGEHLTKPGVSSFACTTVELTPAGEAHPDAAGSSATGPRDLFPLDVDGDWLGDVPLRVEVLAGRLRVLA